MNTSHSLSEAVFLSSHGSAYTRRVTAVFGTNVLNLKPQLESQFADPRIFGTRTHAKVSGS